jgi:hypothetical protein
MGKTVSDQLISEEWMNTGISLASMLPVRGGHSPGTPYRTPKKLSMVSPEPRLGVPPGARRSSLPVSSSGLTMETSGSLRFLENPDGPCPCSSTPAGSGRLSGPGVSCLTRPPLVSRTKAPRVLYFRGSITRPLTWLSTPRGGGRPPLHARLASGCWSGFARRGSYPQWL